MTRPSRRELAEIREDGLSPARRRDFRASERAVARWERGRRAGGAEGLAAALAWIDQLRSVFDDPAVDRSPWRADDLRL